MTDEDIRNAPIRWKVTGAGFVMQGGFVALVDRNPDPYACTAYGGPPEDMEAHLRTCRETSGPPCGRWRATRSKRLGSPWRSTAFAGPHTT